MSLYSYSGKEPQLLPFRFKLEDGSFISPLNNLSQKELEDLGFIGPIEVPIINEDTQKLEWINGEYKIIQLTEEEIREKELEKITTRFQNINYKLFWEKLIESKVYKKLRNLSAESLEINTICTEIIIHLSEAKIGFPDSNQIQNHINLLFFVFEFSEDEVKEFSDIMEETNLSVQYRIPDENYFSDHYYDKDTNKIIRKSPFESWILVKGEWKSPIPYPIDGKVYHWNEQELNWIEI